MTDNPFGGPTSDPSEGGGFDLQAMLEQAQQMQSQLVAAQEELSAATAEGTAGGVTVVLTGAGELSSVTITPGSFDGADADSLADLGDLVVAAFRDAKAQIDALASRTLGPLAGGTWDDLGGGLRRLSRRPNRRPIGGQPGGPGV